jgi:hypothetical protein
MIMTRGVERDYGDFRGSPGELMERYFDAFLYLANWGTRWLMFRLLRTLLDAETARRYCHSEAASVTEADEDEDEAAEPLVPAGLGNLSRPCGPSPSS